MRLRDAIDGYIAWRRAHGAKFIDGAKLLNLFLKGVDGKIDCDAVTSSQVRAFLTGNGNLSGHGANKYSALAGFYRYAISRGYAGRWPLPEHAPKCAPTAPPYIYSRDELHRIFGAIDANRRNAVQLDSHTLRALLLLLYGAGLRQGEALRLTVEDVDLEAAVLTVNDTKFYKSRLVPLGPQLADALRTYAVRRASRCFPGGTASSFLANLDGTPVSSKTLYKAFRLLLRDAGINRMSDTKRQTPFLHSFRHSFAVHRLTAWYREGADVQRLLPALSTYLGHADPSGTQVYLPMTPELLQQAALRFENYARGGDHE